MQAVPLEYLCRLKDDDGDDCNETDNDTSSFRTATPKLYKGPAYIVDDPQNNFPSISRVINESQEHTRTYVPDQYCDDFDRKWHAALQTLFAKHKDCMIDELQEFFDTGRSNGRKLQLQVMVLPPGMYFKIHAHPNIEFELTLRGCLEEFRFLFRVPKDKLGVVRGNGNADADDAPRGPDITKQNSTFQHHKVQAGECMINETGSVHQSFTSNDEPCALIVLWSGCHANTRPEQVEDGVIDDTTATPNNGGQLRPHAGW